MLIESELPSEKQLLKANSITTKLIANSAVDNSNYRHLQLYNQTFSEKKMNSLSHYQLSPASNMPATLNRLNSYNQNLNQNLTPNGMLNQSLNHGTIRPHNQMNGILNGNLAGLSPIQNNNLISNYATISRAAHNQLNGQLNGQLNSTLLSAVPNSQPHLNHHPQAIYQQLTPLNTQINHLSQFHLANGIYNTPQFSLQVGLDLNRNKSCCCCFYKNCNLSRVIAFICGLVVLFLMSLTMASSNWLTSDKYRQGLFQFCVDEGAEMPLPFNIPNLQPGCYSGRDADYIRVAAVLCCFGFILDLLATLMTGFGLCSNSSYGKYTLYKFALYIMIASLISILSALVIYPAWFASEIETSNRSVWEFGYSYGLGWGSCIFLFGAILLLLCDKESNDLYYRERIVIQNPGVREEVKA